MQNSLELGVRDGCEYCVGASAAAPSPVSLLFNFSAVLGVESRVSFVYSAPKPLLLGSALLCGIWERGSTD